MAYTPAYESKINWQNYPSTSTPVDEVNLGKMDDALYAHDRSFEELYGKTLKEVEWLNDIHRNLRFRYWNGDTFAIVLPADNDILSITYNSSDTSLTLRKWNGTTMTVPMYDANEIKDVSSNSDNTQLTLTKWNGTTTTVPINSGGGGSTANLNLSVDSTGSATTSSAQKQTLTLKDGNTTLSTVNVPNTTCMLGSLNLSTLTTTSITFSSSEITTSSVIDVYTSAAKVVYSNMSISNGSCTITFPATEASIAQSIDVKIYIR